MIELLVVLSIIVILATIGMSQYRNSRVYASESVLKTDLFRMREAIDQYYADKGQYPSALDALVSEGYLRKLPDDPFTTCDVPADDAGGDGRAFVFSGVNGGLYAQGPANRWHLFIVDVDGTRLTVVVPYYQGTPQAEVDAAENVVDTLDINP